MLSTVANSHRRLPDTSIANWRLSPHSQWAFQHIRALIPTAEITSAKDPTPLPEVRADSLDSLIIRSRHNIDLPSFLKICETDSMMVLHEGKAVWEWSAPHSDTRLPHIVFSISKSITAMLTGILVNENIIDVDKKISHYLPGTQGSAYEDCSVQQLLDMTVALAFEEDYLNPDGDYVAYRSATGWNPVDQTTNDSTLEPFLYSLNKGGFEHGELFNYKSPNSDLLGLMLERTTDVPYTELLSTLLWQPMGAGTDGYVTVDRAMIARAAGGICMTLADLARFGQLIMDNGAIGDRTIIPEQWIHDTSTGGNREAWGKGSYVTLLPEGCYRNKWYQVGDQDQCIAAIGIHGQWLYINPRARVVIAKLSSQSAPVDEPLDVELLNIFSQISQCLSPA